jgi:hypothetical protein
MSSKAKYLIMAILMTLINIPLFLYSQSMMQRDAIHRAVQVEEPATETVHADASHGGEEANPNDLDVAQDPDKPQPLSPAEIAAQAMAEEEKPERFKSLATLYRPPIFGKCKKLYERFNRKHFPDKPFKSFVYSFDGENAYCADAYTDKGQEQADEIVLRDCEEHHSGSGKYSPCRIYPAE